MARVDQAERFGPYQVYERLGAGGMATVDRATIDIGAGVIREVALKRLLPQLADDKVFIEDFIREGKLAAQLDHPNIVHIYELGQANRIYFIAMELVRGHSLMALMKAAHAAQRPAPIGVVVALLSELTSALEYASAGRGLYGQRLEIIHRDLTPSNLIVTDDGRLKIIDFGVAKALSGTFMTNTGLVKGKLGYMSPEALTGTGLDGRTDIFSVGIVAWELLTGRRLFRGVNEYEVISKIQQLRIEPPSLFNRACPAELDVIVQTALARSREHRWPDAAAMRSALDQVRRLHADGPTQVAAWKSSLIPPRSSPVRMPAPRATPQRVRADSEESLMQLSTIDLLLTPDPDLITPDPELAEGSVKKPKRLEVTTSRRPRDADPTLPRGNPDDDDEYTDVDASIPVTRED
ncbi:MAG: serine/threonine-protein kinase [Kofleriaceae bacterium]|nr:serine/threonine-protein kinase [Kofleriaceae bacterium]